MYRIGLYCLNIKKTNDKGLENMYQTVSLEVKDLTTQANNWKLNPIVSQRRNVYHISRFSNIFDYSEGAFI